MKLRHSAFCVAASLTALSVLAPQPRVSADSFFDSTVSATASNCNGSNKYSNSLTMEKHGAYCENFLLQGYSLYVAPDLRRVDCWRFNTTSCACDCSGAGCSTTVYGYSLCGGSTSVNFFAVTPNHTANHTLYVDLKIDVDGDGTIDAACDESMDVAEVTLLDS